jgi:pseudoazurin
MKDIFKSIAVALSLWAIASAVVLVSAVGPALADTTTIEMLNKREDGAKMVYSQDIVEIAVGDSITWVPTSKGHNVQIIAAPEGFDIPKKSKNSKEVTIEFNTPGIYYYLCTPHKAMGMIGLVVVGGDTSNKDDIAKAKALGKSKKKLKKLLGEL